MSILDRFSLAGKAALVTGASSGLGAGFAVALAEAGARLDIVNIASLLGLVKSAAGGLRGQQGGPDRADTAT